MRFALFVWKAFVFGFALVLPGAFVLAFIILARKIIDRRKGKIWQ